MMTGILEMFQRDAGIVLEEFEDLSYHDECYTIAQQVKHYSQDKRLLQRVTHWRLIFTPTLD